jgi:hypothetical protein
MKRGDAMFGIAVTGAVAFLALHNPFGLWKFLGLLSLGVGIAAMVSGTLLLIIKHQGLGDGNRK